MPIRVRWRIWTLGALVLALACTGFGMSTDLVPPDIIPVARFSELNPSKPLPEKWKPVALAAAYEQTKYELVRTDEGSVLRAHSRGRSASALLTECRVDLATHPILEWRWKVNNVVEGADVRVPSRNDTPARLIVAFEYDDFTLQQRLKIMALRALGWEYSPNLAIMYVWANRGDRHRVVSSPNADWVKLVPLRAGTTHVGSWHTERRNVRADYRKIFGGEPPPVERIAFLTHTNNLKGETTAYYGDISFRRAVPDSAAVDTTLHQTNVDSKKKSAPQ